ncbi:MAG: RDD family protein [Leptolyngbya sp. PLA3]|nr:MAG: RDD family protein [Cyanobacteria bacterium CYA]MCE7968853.1 RDD family protein [Leptolyngbya sp. PL-A3]
MSRRSLHLWVTCLLGVLLGCGASAQTSVCSPPDAENGRSHAWATIPDHLDRAEAGACVLVHAPPRTGDGPTPGGFVQLVRSLQEWPCALAGWGDRVYLVFQQPGKDGTTLVRARSLSAVDRGHAWDYEPVDRLEPYPTLVAGGNVVSSAAWKELLLVVCRLDDGNYTLNLLKSGEWRDLALPGASDGQWIAWSEQEGLHVGRVGAGGMETWGFVEGAPAQPGRWQVQPTYNARRGGRHFALDGLFAEVERDGARLLFRLLLPGEALVSTGSLPARDRSTLMPLLGNGPRLMTIHWADDDQDTGRYPRLEVMEFSLGTGTVLYEGAPPRSDVLSPGEFRTLATMLVALLIGVLVIVLKGDLDQDAVPLPPDTALAGAGRRLLGSLIDLVIAAHITALLYGVNASDLLGLSVLGQPGGQWTAIPMLFIVGGLTGTLCEWGFTRTIGKFLVGCRVVRVRGKVGARPGLVACLVRNGIKWLMPPVAALAALDQNTRHRGDQLAGVAVVIDLEPTVPRQ